ncbi:MAG: hypothetical protein ACRD10_06885, partial [Terriglobia bacterium]
VILTAWPATDELRQPFLGYVNHPLQVAAVDGFRPADFQDPPAFQVAYLYSRKWNPPDNLITLLGAWRKGIERFFQYASPISLASFARQFHLKLLKQLRRRGQWVRIYSAAAR